jgi:hypothetical protein
VADRVWSDAVALMAAKAASTAIATSNRMRLGRTSEWNDMHYLLEIS